MFNLWYPITTTIILPLEVSILPIEPRDQRGKSNHIYTFLVVHSFSNFINISWSDSEVGENTKGFNSDSRQSSTESEEDLFLSASPPDILLASNNNNNNKDKINSSDNNNNNSSNASGTPVGNNNINNPKKKSSYFSFYNNLLAEIGATYNEPEQVSIRSFNHQSIY